MEKLALYGGKPVRDEYLNYGKQYIDEEDITAVTEVLKSEFLTCGPKVKEMEDSLCNITGANHTVAVSNGTAALHLACMAAEICSGDEVIVSPITFAASANSIRYCGGKPVFADIDSKSWEISPQCIEEKITTKTKAVIAVDFMGQAVKLNEISKICRKYGLILIEDAAHSIGTKYCGKMVGDIADLTTFSFHPVKTITAGEGGAVLTNDEKMYLKVLEARSHGITRDKNRMEYRQEGDWYYEQKFLGYNYRITDLQAALCCSQLKKLEIFAERRKKLVSMYNEQFQSMPGVQIPLEIEDSDTVRHLYMIWIDLKRLTADRKTIFNALRAENIGVNVHYIPVYWLPDYQRLGYEKGLCPNAEKFYEGAITLPLHYQMTDDDIFDVVLAVKKVLSYFEK